MLRLCHTVTGKMLSEDAHVAAIGSKSHVECISHRWDRTDDPLKCDVSQQSCKHVLRDTKRGLRTEGSKTVPRQLSHLCRGPTA